MKARPYPKYKASGVDGVGEVPAHWDVRKITYGFKKIGSGTTPKSDSAEYYNGDIPWVTTSELRETIIRQPKQFVTSKAIADHSSLKIYPVGTLLFAMYGATIGRLGILGVPATVNQACCAFAWPTVFVARFVFYWLGMRKPVLISLSAGGGQPNLSQDNLRDIRIPTPPHGEQVAIAEFLDAQTAILDTLAAKKGRLIERLREKRAALISRTVTRGLPPDVAVVAGHPSRPRIKPVDVDWLGAAPMHWEMVPLGYLVRFRGGATPDKAKPEYWDGEIPWVSPKDMKQSRISDAEDHVTTDGLRNSPLAMIPVNAVLIVVRGMILVHSFPVALTEAPVTINQDMKALVCERSASADFLYWLLVGLSGTFVAMADESAHGTRKLETTTLTKFPLMIPLPNEQRAIVDYLDRETSKIDALVTNVQAAIERLQEYRAALITAAVTGKIDVRTLTPDPSSPRGEGSEDLAAVA